MGIVFGTSQMTIHFAYAAVLYYGGTLVREESSKSAEDREIDYGDVFTSVIITLFIRKQCNLSQKDFQNGCNFL